MGGWGVGRQQEPRSWVGVGWGWRRGIQLGRQGGPSPVRAGLEVHRSGRGLKTETKQGQHAATSLPASQLTLPSPSLLSPSLEVSSSP